MDAAILLFGIFFFALILGVPIAYALISSSILVIFLEGIPLDSAVLRLYAGLDKFVLLAVPFFLVMGLLMNIGTITARLFELAEAMFGRTRGAMAMVNVVFSMLMGGISGSAVADVAGSGSMMIPTLIKNGYPRSFVVAVTAASSTIGGIIPPSILMAVYGAYGGISIGALFLGGVIPGLVIGLTQLGYCFAQARIHDFPRGEPFKIGRFSKALSRGLLPFGATLIVLGGLIGGVFTATEAASVGVLYILALSAVLYRSISIASLKETLVEAGRLLGPILLCVAGGSLFAWVLAYLQVPSHASSLFQRWDLSPTATLLIIMVLFMVVGTFESSIASIIIFLPIVQPAAVAVGLDPVHVGVVICMTLGMGLITPPYGLCLFIAAKIGRMTVERASIALLPWVGLFIVVDLLCIFFPELVLFLPRLLMPEAMN